MRFSRNRHRASNDDAILPLTNVVFLLLIFFMLAGRLASPQTFDIHPPRSDSDAPAQIAGLEVQIAANGDLALNNKPIDLDTLEATVKKRLTETPGIPLRLRADGAGDATRVVKVMHLLHDAGADKLRLVTVPPEG